MDIETRNRQVLETVGPEKVLRALSEVAVKIDPQEDYRPLLDRAYEVGLRPDWDGSVDFQTAVLIGGQPCHSIIDVEEALNEDESFERGYIDRQTYDLGKRLSQLADQEADADLPAPDEELEATALTTSTTSCSRLYGWGVLSGSYGFNKGAWGVPFGSATYHHNRTIRRHGVQGGRAGGGKGGRAYWEYMGAGHNSRQWSRWVLERGTCTRFWQSWSVNVAAYRAQVGYGW